MLYETASFWIDRHLKKGPDTPFPVGVTKHYYPTPNATTK